VKGYPPWFTSTKVHGLILALVASGVLLVPSTLNAYLGFDFPWRLSSPSRIWVTAIHVAFSFLVLLVVGALWSIHMRYWWRKRQGRISGTILLSVLGVLTFGSLPVLYAAEEEVVSIAALLHAGLGLALVIPYALHAIIGVKKSE
jgi:heme A synthase